MKHYSNVAKADWLMGLTLVFWLVLFLIGGGSRADIQSLIILRPFAVLLLGLGLWQITKNDFKAYAFLYVFAGATALVVIAHLIPLPQNLWSGFPGRNLIAETDQISGIAPVWRPLSLLPTDSWNALFALLIPIVTLVLLSRVAAPRHYLMLALCLLIGLFSAFLAILQMLGPDNSPLYFYRITNRGMAVGLFANRNHHAVFLACLLPMLAVFASSKTLRFGSPQFRLWVSGSIGTFLLLLIMVSGSRAGLLVALIGLCAVPILFRPDDQSGTNNKKPRKFGRVNYRLIIPGAAVAAVTAVAIFTSNADSFDRLLAGGKESDIRFEVWGPIANIAWYYFPIGSGAGTFADVYKIHESSTMLSAEYLNHAHNDLLELLLTMGLPGALLLLLAVVVWAKEAYFLFFRQLANDRYIRIAQLGAVIIFMLAVASLVDYPLRTPSLSGLLMLSAIWMVAGKKASLSVNHDK
jgi:O-antigen ligase